MKKIKSKYDKMMRLVSSLNLPDYRYEQITKAVFLQRMECFSDMYLLPKQLRDALTETFGDHVIGVSAASSQSSEQTSKLLFRLSDSKQVEAIGLKYERGWESFCISSQCGCGFDCRFCATGTIGLKRNLTADEITDQLLYFLLRGHKLSSISFMGMGEALANPYLFDALAILTDPALFALSQRRITISTIGIIPGIQKLAQTFPQVNLAFSLHSPFEGQRSELMPVNKRFPLREVMYALDDHIRNTGRRVFIAYIMLKGVNDSAEHAQALAGILRDRGSWKYLYHVDLIPYNSTDKTLLRFQASDRQSIGRFSKILKESGISVAVRTQFGSDISAACGQLYC